MGILGTHPAVFLRVANKGDRSGQRIGMEVRPGISIAPPPRLFFVSVASKELSSSVTLLFTTLAGRSVTVAAKGLKAIVGGNLGRVGAGRRMVVSREKDGEHRLERIETFPTRSESSIEAQGKRPRTANETRRKIACQYQLVK